MNEKVYQIEKEKDLYKTAIWLLQKAGGKKIWAIYGEMGAGKTTLIKQLCKQLGVTENVNSPTFSIVNEYLSTKNETIYHFDFYRIEMPQEAIDMGVEEYFHSGSYCFIEWAEKIENLLPEDVFSVKINILGSQKREFLLI